MLIGSRMSRRKADGVWVPQAKYYRLMIQNAAGVEILSAALLSNTRTYSAPSWLSTQATDDLLRWQVLAFDAKGTKLSETILRTLRILRE